MPRLLMAGLVLGLAGLGLVAAVVYAQMDGSQSATGTINAAGGAPTPRPHVQGDVDCSGGANPVSAVDALKILRFVATLSVTQTEPCDNIGTGGPPVQGNVDCSGGANPVGAVDALKILRSIAALPVAQTEPCDNIGTPPPTPTPTASPTPTPTPSPTPTPTPSPVPTPEPGYDAAVWAGSATAPPNNQVTVDLTVTVAPGVTLGALAVTVTYDNTALDVANCQVPSGVPGVCEPDFTPNSVRFTVVSLLGLSGKVGQTTFNTKSTVVTTSLAVSIQDCTNTLGDPLVCSAHNGSITVTSGVAAAAVHEILRFVAALPVSQQQGCRPLGT